jgi:hypothetical protein
MWSFRSAVLYCLVTFYTIYLKWNIMNQSCNTIQQRINRWHNKTKCSVQHWVSFWQIPIHLIKNKGVNSSHSNGIPIQVDRSESLQRRWLLHCGINVHPFILDQKSKRMGQLVIRLCYWFTFQKLMWGHGWSEVWGIYPLFACQVTLKCWS